MQIYALHLPHFRHQNKFALKFPPQQIECNNTGSDCKQAEQVWGMIPQVAEHKECSNSNSSLQHLLWDKSRSASLSFDNVQVKKQGEKLVCCQLFCTTLLRCTCQLDFLDALFTVIPDRLSHFSFLKMESHKICSASLKQNTSSNYALFLSGIIFLPMKMIHSCVRSLTVKI